MYDAFQGDLGYNFSPAPLGDEVVRSALLYWDRIDIPDNDFATLPLPSEYQVLISNGIVTRTHISIYGASPQPIKIAGGTLLNAVSINGRNIEEFGDKLNAVPLRAFEELQKEKEVFWAYLKNSKTAETPEEEGMKGRSLLFEIPNRLYIPNAGVQFNDILEYKQKRGEELAAFWSAIDDVYYKISNANDIEHARGSEFDKLDIALSDMKKSSQESFPRMIAKSFRFEINPVNMVSAAAVAAALTPSVPIIAATAFASGFKLDFADTFFGNKLPSRNAPYRYALDAESSLEK